MRMHNPPHPAATIKEDVLPELGLSVTAAAKQLGVSRAPSVLIWPSDCICG